MPASGRSRSHTAFEPSEPTLRAAHERAFRERFGVGAAPRVFFAPGRVNLMGAHLDYNGGPVMPMAIDRGTFVALAPRSDRVLRLASTLEPGAVELALDAPPPASGHWYDYPLGVVHALRGGGHAATCGADVLFGGNLAIGAGLSSSASITVATAFALDALWSLGLARRDHVQVALWAEREFVGVRCGIMDPHAVGLSRPGHLLWLDCRDETTEHLLLDTDAVSIAVADTGVRRELAHVAFNERVRECGEAFERLRRHVPEATCLRDVPLDVLREHEDELDATVARRARHVLEEVARTFTARDALRAGDVETFGAQMTAAHASLRELFEVSVPELDCLVDAAAACEGVLGSRLTGAGFGGCTVVLLRSGAREELESALGSAFERRFGRAPRVAVYRGDGGPRELLAGG